MKKGTSFSLNEVSTAFTFDWIVAKILLTFLNSFECTRIEQLSKAWQVICLQHWQKKSVGVLIENILCEKPWQWRSKLSRNHLKIDFVKIYFCVNEYIKAHNLKELGKDHLSSKWVARDMLDGRLTIYQAGSRGNSAAVTALVEKKGYFFQKAGIKLGIDPAFLLSEDGQMTGFGPFHIKLVDQHGVPPDQIHDLSPDEIKALPEMKTLCL